MCTKPPTRKKLLKSIVLLGYGLEELNSLKILIDAENSDLFDVLEHFFKNVMLSPLHEQNE